MNRTMHALKNVVCYGLAVMFVINLAGAAQDASLTGSNVVAWTCAVLGVLVFALARSESAVPAIMRPSGGAFLAAVSIVYLASRLAWILSFTSDAASDFQAYHDLASRFAQGVKLPEIDTIKPWGLLSWGYPWLLSFLYRIFGPDLLVARVLNLFAGLGSLLLIYRLARQNIGAVHARYAALLFLFWPAQFFYSGLNASEHLSLLLALVFIAVFLGVLRQDRWPWLRASLAGLVIAVSCMIRQANLLLLLAGVGLLVFSGPTCRRRYAQAGTLLLVFIVTMFSYRAELQRAYNAAPHGALWFNLMIGTNASSFGQWNPEDSQKYVEHETFAQADAYARQVFWRRISSSPVQTARLMAQKESRYWKNQSLLIQWSMTSDSTPPVFSPRTVYLFFTINQWYFLFVMAMFLAGLFRLAKRPPEMMTLLFLLWILASTLAHTLLECQARYHYQQFAGLIIIAGIGLLGSRQGSPDEMAGPAPCTRTVAKTGFKA